MRRLAFLALVVVASTSAVHAAGTPAARPSEACSSLLGRTPEWQPAVAKPGEPRILRITGDFNADGRPDQATLGRLAGVQAAAVCLAGARAPIFIAVGECSQSDALILGKAGTKVPNYDDPVGYMRLRRLRRDAVIFNCAEKSSTTYVYGKSGFKGFLSGD